MGRKLGASRHKNLLSDFLIQSLDEHITSMAGVQAACERIQNTSLPFPIYYWFSAQRISTALFYLLA
jgi:putative membrane protein